MINFNTENLIIVLYTPGAGGKFLINSLGLSDSAVFQDAELAERQLNNEFNQKDKFDYLITKLNDTITWNDLGLGCYKLFGIINEEYYEYSDILPKFKDFNKIIKPLSNSDKKFFLAAEWPSIIKEYLKVWPNAKIISFINPTNFIIFRSNTLEKIWDQYKGDSWPPTPQTFSDVPTPIRLELKNRFQIDLNQMEHRYKIAEEYINNSISEMDDNTLIWNTNWYFNEHETISGIKHLYQQLNLENFNEELIRSYYRKWIDKIPKS